MAKNNEKARLNIPMCLACVLFCLTLFSMHFTGGLYAKYTAKGNGGDSARVAAFDVDSEWAGSVNINVAKSGEKNGSYTFKVSNNSEVAIKYDLVITFDKDIPSYLSVELNGKTGTKSGNRELLFSDVGSIAPGGSPAGNTLLFSVSSIDGFSDGAHGESRVINLSFNAVLKCEQID